MHNIVARAARSFHNGCLSSVRNFPGAVCLFPNMPSGLTETLEIKCHWSPLLRYFFFLTLWRKRCRRSHHCGPESTPLSFPVEEQRSRISIWAIKTLQNIGLKKNWSASPPPTSEMYYLYDGHRNTRRPAPSASAQPMFLQLFTSGPLGGFQTHRLRESISMWGYFIQAHHLRPGIGTGPNLGMRLRGGSRFRAFNPGLVFRDNLCHGGTAESRQ